MNMIKEDTIRKIVRKQLIKNFGALNEARSAGVKAVMDAIGFEDTGTSLWPTGLDDAIQKFLKKHLSDADVKKYTGTWKGAKIEEADGPDTVFPRSAQGLADFLMYVKSFQDEPEAAADPAPGGEGGVAPTLGAVAARFKAATEEQRQLAREWSAPMLNLSTANYFEKRWEDGLDKTMRRPGDYKEISPTYFLGVEKRLEEVKDDNSTEVRWKTGDSTLVYAIYYMALGIAESEPGIMALQIDKLNLVPDQIQVAIEILDDDESPPDVVAAANTKAQGEQDEVVEIVAVAAEKTPEIEVEILNADGSVAGVESSGNTDAAAAEEEDAASAARAKEAAAAAAEEEATSAAKRAEDIESAEDMGVGVEESKANLERFVVTDQDDKPAFVIRMPDSFVSLASDEGTKQRGFIGRAFGSDTLRAFREDPRSSGGDQPFVINWGGYGSTMDMSSTMFGTDTLKLNDIEDLGFEPGIKRKRVKGQLKVAFSALAELYKKANRDLKKLEKERTPDKEKLKTLRAEEERLGDLVKFMNNSSYERLRIRKRDGSVSDRFRYTPRSRGGDVWNAASIKAVEDIFLNRNKSGARIDEAVEEIAMEKLIRKLIKDEN